LRSICLTRDAALGAWGGPGGAAEAAQGGRRVRSLPGRAEQLGEAGCPDGSAWRASGGPTAKARQRSHRLAGGSQGATAGGGRSHLIVNFVALPSVVQAGGSRRWPVARRGACACLRRPRDMPEALPAMTRWRWLLCGATAGQRVGAQLLAPHDDDTAPVPSPNPILRQRHGVMATALLDSQSMRSLPRGPLSCTRPFSVCCRVRTVALTRPVIVRR
jgi:hypothetical protein